MLKPTTPGGGRAFFSAHGVAGVGASGERRSCRSWGGDTDVVALPQTSSVR
jgi:hypothetical protein